MPILFMCCRKLSICLPHTVNDEDGEALWDVNYKLLIVTLPIARDGIL